MAEVVDERTQIGQLQRGSGLVRTETNMKSRSQDQSLSDSRELDRSYDPLTGTCSFLLLLFLLLKRMWGKLLFHSLLFADLALCAHESLIRSVIPKISFLSLKKHQRII